MNPTLSSFFLRKTGSLLAALCLAAIALGAGGASAAIVTTYNTGHPSPFSPTSLDANYKLVTAAGVPVNVPAAVALNQPNVWLPTLASPGSAWIEPQWQPGAALPLTPVTAPGLYVYETTFDLSNFNTATAIFSGRFLVDDGLNLDIWVNGASIGTSFFTVPSNYTNWASFAFNSSNATLLQNASNKLQFRFQNVVSRTGLRVEYVGEAQLIPEPSSLALVGSALVALGLRSRGRRELRTAA